MEERRALQVDIIGNNIAIYVSHKEGMMRILTIDLTQKNIVQYLTEIPHYDEIFKL